MDVEDLVQVDVEEHVLMVVEITVKVDVLPVVLVHVD